MKPPTRPGKTIRLDRRSALRLGAGALSVVAVGGCAVSNPLGDHETRSPRAVRELAPDVAVAVEAVTLVRGAEAAVASTGAQHPALATRLADLLALHQAHLAAVVDAVPPGVGTTGTGPAYVVPPRPARALADLAAAERSLHDGLVGLAVRAESGGFARLLGAMAAAVSQRLPGLAA